MDGAMAGLRGWRRVVQRQMDAYGFSPAEQRVAWSLFDVHTNNDVGTTLSRSPQTVKNQMTKMMHKTKTTNRLALVLTLLHLADEDFPTQSAWSAAAPQRRQPD
jgi:DNA-binding CsgD family transcriptional regulator